MGTFSALIVWEGGKVPKALEIEPTWFDDYLDAVKNPDTLFPLLWEPHWKRPKKSVI